MTVHNLPLVSVEDFKKIFINESDNIVGYYMELRRDGTIRGSYITDNSRQKHCEYEDIRILSQGLSVSQPRLYHNIPIELYIDMYQNFIIKECHKMHTKWSQVPYDDIRQMFCEALVKCYNKGLYIGNSRVILRSFYNNVYTHVRKNYNWLVNTDSLDEEVNQEDDSPVSRIDTIEDESLNPEYLEALAYEEQDKIEKLRLVADTLKTFGYGERTMQNILFEIEHKAQSRDTRRIIDRLRERFRVLGLI